MNLKKETEQELRQILQEQAHQAVPDNTDPWIALQARLNQTGSSEERNEIMSVETPIKPDRETQVTYPPLTVTPGSPGAGLSIL